MIEVKNILVQIITTFIQLILLYKLKVELQIFLYVIILFIYLYNNVYFIE